MRYATVFLATATTVATALTASPRKYDSRTAVELIPTGLRVTDSRAVAINNRGDVVGYSADDGFDAVERATLWPRKGTPADD
jgi:hypothetical protein